MVEVFNGYVVEIKDPLKPYEMRTIAILPAYKEDDKFASDLAKRLSEGEKPKENNIDLSKALQRAAVAETRLDLHLRAETAIHKALSQLRLISEKAQAFKYSDELPWYRGYAVGFDSAKEILEAALNPRKDFPNDSRTPMQKAAQPVPDADSCLECGREFDAPAHVLGNSHMGAHAFLSQKCGTCGMLERHHGIRDHNFQQVKSYK